MTERRPSESNATTPTPNGSRRSTISDRRASVVDQVALADFRRRAREKQLVFEKESAERAAKRIALLSNIHQMRAQGREPELSEAENALRNFDLFCNANPLTLTPQEAIALEKHDGPGKPPLFRVDQAVVAEQRRLALEKQQRFKRIATERAEIESKLVCEIERLQNLVSQLSSQPGGTLEEQLQVKSEILGHLQALETLQKQLEDHRAEVAANPLVLTAQEETALREHKALETLREERQGTQEQDDARRTFHVDQRELTTLRKKALDKQQFLQQRTTERAQKEKELSTVVDQLTSELTELQQQVGGTTDIAEKLQLAGLSLSKAEALSDAKQALAEFHEQCEAEPLEPLSAQEEMAIMEHRALERLRQQKEDRERRTKEEKAKKTVIDNKKRVDQTELHEFRRRAIERQQEVEQELAERAANLKRMQLNADRLTKEVAECKSKLARVEDPGERLFVTQDYISKLQQLSVTLAGLEEYKHLCDENPLALTPEEQLAVLEYRALEKQRIEKEQREMEEQAQQAKLRAAKASVDPQRLNEVLRAAKEKHAAIQFRSKLKENQLRDLKEEIDSTKSQISALDSKLHDSTAPMERLENMQQKMELMQVLIGLEEDYQRIEERRLSIELTREEEAALRGAKLPLLAQPREDAMIKSMKAFGSFRRGSHQFTRRRSGKVNRLKLRQIVENQRQASMGKEDDFATNSPPAASVDEADLTLAKQILGMVSIFKEAATDNTFVDDMVSRLQPLTFDPGNIVVKQGDVGKEMYFVLRGELEVVDQNQQHLATLNDGNFFGEIALLFNSKRTATVRAKSFCSLLLLEKDSFDNVLKDYPEYLEKVEEAAERRLQDLIKQTVMNVGIFKAAAHNTTFLGDVYSKLTKREYASEEVIVRKGEVGTEMFFVSHGELRVVSGFGRDGKVLGVLATGDFFGEIALLQNSRRTATIVANGPCEVLVLSKADFDEVAKSHPYTMKAIFDAAADRLKALVEKERAEYEEFSRQRTAELVAAGALVSLTTKKQDGAPKARKERPVAPELKSSPYVTQSQRRRLSSVGDAFHGADPYPHTHPQLNLAPETLLPSPPAHAPEKPTPRHSIVVPPVDVHRTDNRRLSTVPGPSPATSDGRSRKFSVAPTEPQLLRKASLRFPFANKQYTDEIDEEIDGVSRQGTDQYFNEMVQAMQHALRTQKSRNRRMSRHLPLTSITAHLAPKVPELVKVESGQPSAPHPPQEAPKPQHTQRRYTVINGKPQ